MKTTTLVLLLLAILNIVNAQNFTFGTIPDTQNLTETDEDAELITDITKWYVDKRDSLNLLFVASLGDMTQWGAEEQWQRVRKSYDVFKKAGMPYAPCQGNHDPDLDVLNKYFPVKEFKKTESYGGNLNGIHNAYYLFSSDTMDFIVVVIQSHDQYIGPYDTASIDWANHILNKYNNRHAIFITHDFFERQGLVNDLITKHDNLFLAICGHSCAREAYWVETSPNGRPVHCIMSDYQCDPDKGATLRYYNFDVKEQMITAYTYNITTRTFETDSNSQFSFAMPETLIAKPVITDISNYPVFPKSNEKTKISAKIFSKNEIAKATVIWGIDSLSLNNETALTLSNQNYFAQIPENNDNSTVYYQIKVQNSLNETSTSAVYKFEICDDGSCLTCPFKLTETAFKNEAAKIPGIIEAENYNDGCNGVAYFDNDDDNVGGAYRNDGVDISNCNEGGFNVGWIKPGEWLKYRVEVLKDGKYDLKFRTASHGHNSIVHIEVDGKDISGPIKLPGTNGWQDWITARSQEIELKKGFKDIKLVVDEGEFNFNYIEVNVR